MGRQGALAALATAVVTAAGAAPAAAAGPGRWERIGTVGLADPQAVVERSLAPGSGVRVVHVERTATGETLHSVDLTRSGRVVRRGAVDGVSGWSAIHSLDLIPGGSGWTLLFGGDRTTDEPDDGYSGVLAATAPPDGPWTLAAAPVSSDPFASFVAGGAGGDTAPLVAWNSGRDVRATAGLAPNQDGTVVATNAFLRDIAVSGRTGRAWLLYATRDSRELRAQEIAADGTPIEDPRTAPRSEGYLPTRTPHLVSSRAGQPHVWAAYAGNGFPARDIVLWRVGTHNVPSFVRYDSGDGRSVRPPFDSERIVPTSDPEGRVWVVWTHGRVVHATRTSFPFDRFPFERKVRVRAPGPIIDLDASGAGDRLDIVVTTAGRTPSESDYAVWHTQAIAPLGIHLGRDSRPRRSGGRVRFHVTEGAPWGVHVPGAAVTARGRRGTTDEFGVVELDLPPLRRGRYVTVRARHPRHGAGVRRFRIRASRGR